MEQYEINWKNYYDILKVAPTANAQEIKAAYRRLALKYHPDQTADSLGWDRMAEINEAYEVLSHPTRRARYHQVYRSTYAPLETSTGKRTYETPETEFSGGSYAKTAFEQEKATGGMVGWAILGVLFCSVVLFGILVTIAGGHSGLLAAVLAFLTAVFLFVAIASLRALLQLATSWATGGTPTRAPSTWDVIVLISIAILTLVGGCYAAVKFLQILVFEPLAK